MVEGRRRRRHQGVQRAAGRPGQGRAGAGRVRHRRRHAGAHPVPARRARGAARPQTPDHDRHAQQCDRSRGRQGARNCGLRHAVLRQSDRGYRDRTDAGTDPPHRLRECAPQGRRALAEHDRQRSRGQDPRRHRPGQARRSRGRHRQGVRHEGAGLEPEPHAGQMPRGRRRLCEQGRPLSPGRFRQRACPAEPAHARPDRRARRSD